MGTQRWHTAVFVVIAGILFAATALFATLYVVERRGADEVGTRIAGVERELADGRERVRTGRSTVDELDDGHDELRSANEALHACADPAEDGITAALNGDDAAMSSAIDTMLVMCAR